MKIRKGVSAELLKNVEVNERLYYTALQILESGFYSFKSFAFELLDDEGEEILPYIKSLYVGFYFSPDLQYQRQFMDSPQKVDEYNMDEIPEEWKNNFRMQEEDLYAIEIARSVVKKLLMLKNIAPKDIVAIGHYLYALERLPVKTDGVDTHIEINYRDGDENFRETKTYAFRINNEYFHIDVMGDQHQAGVGGDSISYPGWYVARTGGRDCECELSSLEDEIDEYLALGAYISTEDLSTINEI